MNKNILEALVKLFAILGKVSGAGTDGRALVISYLRELLNESQAEEAIPVYDAFSQSSTLAGFEAMGLKKLTLLSVKIIGLCTTISSELTQQQRVLIALRILEFLSKKNALSELERGFFDAVCDSFTIGQHEQADMLELAASHADTQQPVISSTRLLHVHSRRMSMSDTCPVWVVDGLKGELVARLFKEEGLIAFRAFGVSEPLLINGQLAGQSALHIISEGASVKVGGLVLHYAQLMRHALGLNTEPNIAFEVTDVSYAFSSGHMGIHPLSFCENSGRMVGIMGGSGAGKSTMLAILNGSCKPTTGQVLINGTDLYAGQDALKGLIGFVSQDDLLIEELTVFENLYYSAKLSFGSLEEDVVVDKVNRVLTQLGLDTIAHLQVGGAMHKVISGGQRKRLNIALELIREPLVLFADEPTSGLSSSDSEQVIDLLRQQALGGRLVFVVIHQPSSDIFKRFDKLLILDRGGYAAYYGEPLGAITWFKHCAHYVRPDEAECAECGNVNPEQVFNIVENKVLDEFGRPTDQRKVAPIEWYDRFRASRPGRDFVRVDEMPDQPVERSGFFGQFSVYLRRDLNAKIKNRQFLVLVLLVPIVLAGLLSCLMRSGPVRGYEFVLNANVPAYVFIAVIVSIFLGLMLSAEQIIRDRLILKREAFLNLNSNSYLMAKVTVLFGITAIQSLLFALIGNTIIGLPGMLFPFWAILFATGTVASMMGLILSAYLNSVVTIYISIPLIIIPQILLSGVLVKYTDLIGPITRRDAVPVVGEVMVSKWAYEALVVKLFRDNEYERPRFRHDQEVSMAHFKKVHWSNLMEDLVRDHVSGTGPRTAKETDRIIRAELDDLDPATLPTDVGPMVDRVTSSITLEGILPLMERLKEHYKEQYTAEVANRDRVLVEVYKGKDMQALMKRNTNGGLRALVEGRNGMGDFAVIEGDRIVPTYDPVYLSPSQSWYLRARLFSTEKPLFGRYFDTYLINLMMIFGMALLMFIPLSIKLRQRS